MASSPLADIEELARCSCCKRAFDDVERVPKLLACKHHFCLACARGVLAKGRDVCCPHCWKRTELLEGHADTLPTHGAVLALARRLALDPIGVPALEPCTERVARDSRLLRADLHRLAARRRDFLLRTLDAATALKVRLETELAAPPLEPFGSESTTAEREQLRARHSAALRQCRLDDLVRSAGAPLAPAAVRHALAGIAPDPTTSGRREPALLLANYCLAQLYARDSPDDEPAESPPPRAPGPYPLFYFDLEVNGAPFGRVLIEVRNDIAPRMARNFTALASGELGVGYRGCVVFQCWENESVITGDFELNNGRGGRSVFEESYFMPDDTRMAAVRGAVGMRRSQKRHDNLGLVGSQFRIMLREMRGFTAIFGFVVEGLELVDRLSRTGDGAGKPHSTILIASCGKLN